MIIKPHDRTIQSPTGTHGSSLFSEALTNCLCQSVDALSSLRTKLRLALLILFFCSQASAQYRKEILLENGWKFFKGDVPAASLTGYNDSHWRAVRIPHDWAIYGPFDQDNDAQIVKITQK